ncbi:response regulator [Vibrio amylolyticus]|uniref:response regulator n=1 Tax=Vibrio amylolyticus TaxID=2847292 RepID=UPI00354EC6A1
MDCPKDTRLLLVEDSKVNQRFAQALLEDLGFKVVIAQHGADAIEFLLDTANEAPIELVLMDCEMPVMNGYEATKSIRQGKAGDDYKQIPIIAMTASGTLGDEKICFTAGMNDHLPKPISTQKLRLKLERYLVNAEVNAACEKRAPISSSVPTNSAHSPLTWDRESALRRLNHSDEYMVMILKTFLDSLPPQIGNLEKALNSNELETVRMEFHSLKGVAGNISAMALMKQASDMERLVKAKQLTTVNEQWPQFLQELEQLKSVLLAYISEVSE